MILVNTDRKMTRSVPKTANITEVTNAETDGETVFGKSVEALELKVQFVLHQHAENIILSRKTMIVVVLLVRPGALKDSCKVFKRMVVRSIVGDILVPAALQSQAIGRRRTCLTKRSA